MIFPENRLLADNSHEITYLIFFLKIKMSQNLLSAAVVIGALKVNTNLDAQFIYRYPMNRIWFFLALIKKQDILY